MNSQAIARSQPARDVLRMAEYALTPPKSVSQGRRKGRVPLADEYHFRLGIIVSLTPSDLIQC